MRVFIAIPLTQNIKNDLSRIQIDLKTCGAEIKWVPSENTHLTLKFLGEINEITLNKIIGAIEETMQNHEKFKIGLSDAGAFPDAIHPKVIWIGVKEGKNKVENIVYALEKKIESLGIPREKRPFSCHITLGRTKSSRNSRELMERLDNLRDNLYKENLSFTAEEITIFKSRLSPSGAFYEALKEITLKDT